MTEANHVQLPSWVVNTTRGEVNLSDFQTGWLLLYFYPKDATSGCTTQANEFTALLPEFEALHVNIFGISRDSINSHHKFKTNQHIGFDLISDSEQQLCQYFDVIKPKNMYGKVGYGIERSTFIFHDGQLVYSERKVKAAGHAARILEWFKSYIN